MNNLLGTELLVAYSIQANVTYETTPDGTPVRTSMIITTQDIANLSGGGGLASQQIITSGSSANATLSQFIGMNSASGLAKVVHAPTSTGSLKEITVSDLFGDAGANPISFVPATGSVVGAQDQVYTNYGSGTWLDTADGWAQI